MWIFVFTWSLQGSNLRRNRAAQRAEASRPLLVHQVLLLFFIKYGSDHKQELESFFLLDELREYRILFPHHLTVLTQKTQLSLHRVLSFPLDDHVERVPHYRDQHVENHNLGEKRGHSEEQDAEVPLRMFLKVCVIPIAE